MAEDPIDNNQTFRDNFDPIPTLSETVLYPSLLLHQLGITSDIQYNPAKLIENHNPFFPDHWKARTVVMAISSETSDVRQVMANYDLKEPILRSVQIRKFVEHPEGNYIERTTGACEYDESGKLIALDIYTHREIRTPDRNAAIRQGLLFGVEPTYENFIKEISLEDAPPPITQAPLDRERVNLIYLHEKPTVLAVVTKGDAPNEFSNKHYYIYPGGFFDLKGDDDFMIPAIIEGELGLTVTHAKGFGSSRLKGEPLQLEPGQTTLIDFKADGETIPIKIGVTVRGEISRVQ